jgi:hypothetical protein
MNDPIHIVCLDAPSPPDYGGAIDMFYKIRALHSIGKKIILHYFNYKGKRNTIGLEDCCDEIHAYERSSFLSSLLTQKPYIISSRTSAQLIHRLNADNYPVLLEGLHCSGVIPHLAERKVMIRMHNDEAVYYDILSKTEASFLKRLYYRYESSLLSRYQKKLLGNISLTFLSEADEKLFKEKYHYRRTFFVPLFIPWQRVESKPGKGEYCLYHGNLTVSENVKAAEWLIEKVFSKADMPLIIAGKNAKALQGICSNYGKIKLVTNPSDAELTELIQNAHINVLPSMNATGVKLKLIHALLKGRFCITNYSGVAGSQLENHVALAETVEDWIRMIQSKQASMFSNDMIEARKAILSIYNNKLNAEKLIEVW